MTAAIVPDANVLFSACLRDLWLELSHIGVVRVHLTESIDDEWTAAIARLHPGHASTIARTRAMMRARFWRDYIPLDEIANVTFGLPDPLMSMSRARP